LLVIKRVLPELARDGELVRMLLDEARIAATLQHSNIVQVFDVDMDDGNVFFAMEHLHGQDVAELVRRAGARAIPLENATRGSRWMFFTFTSGFLDEIQRAPSTTDAKTTERCGRPSENSVASVPAPCFRTCSSACSMSISPQYSASFPL